jgi:hypothetical protein
MEMERAQVTQRRMKDSDGAQDITKTGNLNTTVDDIVA